MTKYLLILMTFLFIGCANVGVPMLENGNSDIQKVTHNDFSAEKIYRFTYTIEVPASIHADEDFSLWVPYPASNSAQQVLSTNIDSPYPFEINSENKHGNTMLYFSGKKASKPTTITLNYVIKRTPHSGTNHADLNMADKDKIKQYLSPNKLIPLHATITELAEQESHGMIGDALLVSTFYDSVYNMMSYNKTGDGWGKGDAVWACSSKRGNCTDFHSLYMGMSRNKDIPARFVMGVPIHKTRKASDIPGYHCWAEVYVKNEGWRPVDISNAKKEGVGDKYFGYIPSDRIELATGRDLILSPKQNGAPLNYFVYPYAEVEGNQEKFASTFHYEILQN